MSNVKGVNHGRDMDMEMLRGRVPLDIDNKNNLNASTKAKPMKNFSNAHHSQNHNIFEEPIYG